MLFALVGVGVLVSALAAGVGLSGLGSVNGSVNTLDQHVVKPLAAFASLRDAEGDSRVNVNAYLAATTAQEWASVSSDVGTSDQAVAQGIAADLAAHGSTTDSRARLMQDFAARFATWKQGPRHPGLQAGRSGTAGQGPGRSQGPPGRGGRRHGVAAGHPLRR